MFEAPHEFHSKPGWAVPIDTSQPSSSHLNLDFYKQERNGYPDQELISFLALGVRYKSDLPVLIVLQPHLNSFLPVQEKYLSEHHQKGVAWKGCVSGVTHATLLTQPCLRNLAYATLLTQPLYATLLAQRCLRNLFTQPCLRNVAYATSLRNVAQPLYATLFTQRCLRNLFHSLLTYLTRCSHQGDANTSAAPIQQAVRALAALTQQTTEIIQPIPDQHSTMPTQRWAKPIRRWDESAVRMRAP